MAAITSRERVQTAVAHRQPDRVPYYLSFTQAAAEKTRAYYGVQDLDQFLANDMVRHSIRRPSMQTEITPGHFRDEFGVVWNRTIDRDIGIPEGQVLPERTLKGYTWPDPLDPRRYADLPAFIAAYPDNFRILGFSMTMFERAYCMRWLDRHDDRHGRGSRVDRRTAGRRARIPIGERAGIPAIRYPRRPLWRRLGPTTRTALWGQVMAAVHQTAYGQAGGGSEGSRKSGDASFLRQGAVVVFRK